MAFGLKPRPQCHASATCRMLPLRVACFHYIACRMLMKLNVFNFFQYAERNSDMFPQCRRLVACFRDTSNIHQYSLVSWDGFSTVVSSWVRNGANHCGRHGTFDKSYDTLAGNCSWCPSIVLCSHLKLIGDIHEHMTQQHFNIGRPCCSNWEAAVTECRATRGRTSSADGDGAVNPRLRGVEQSRLGKYRCW